MSDWVCEECHRNWPPDRDGCEYCGTLRPIPLVHELDIGELTISFSPAMISKDENGEVQIEQHIIGQMSLECKYMPDDLQQKIQDWVTAACEAQDVPGKYLRRGS